MKAFKSEWVKLNQASKWLGFTGSMIGWSLLATILMFASASGADVGLEEGDFISAAALSQPDGSVFAISQMGTFLGVIALALFASNFAAEFSRGTIRLLFVTEPSRLKVLAGKLSALGSFAALGVALSLAASVATGAVIADGVDTSAWWTLDGFSAMGVTYLNVTGSVLAAGLLGAALAVIGRSATAAISVGAIYLIAVEPLAAIYWKPLAEWGPAAAFASMASGGAPLLDYGRALVIVAALAAIGLTVSSLTLVRRDVTS